MPRKIKPAPVNEWTPEVFAKEFFATVDQIYAEWCDDEEEMAPDFEIALERAKREGVQALPSEKATKK